MRGGEITNLRITTIGRILEGCENRQNYVMNEGLLGAGCHVRAKNNDIYNSRTEPRVSPYS
jgi:hypothetical protein